MHRIVSGIVFFAVIVTPAVGMSRRACAQDTSTVQKALATASEDSRFWRAAQGLPGTNSAVARLLNNWVRGRNLDAQTLNRYADRWDRRHGRDLQLAIRWCQYQASLNTANRLLWQQRADALERGQLQYTDRVSGVLVEDVYAWSYLARFYRIPTA